MNIRESLAAGPSTIVIAEGIEGWIKPEKLQWRVNGASLRVSRRAGVDFLDVFVLDKVVKSALPARDFKLPMVVRVIDQTRPDEVVDYLSYPNGDEISNVSVFVAPRNIPDLAGYYKKQWPTPLSTPSPETTEFIDAMARTALSEPGTLVEIGNGLDVMLLKNIGALSVDQAGSLPYYPVWTNPDFA